MMNGVYDEESIQRGCHSSGLEGPNHDLNRDRLHGYKTDRANRM